MENHLNLSATNAGQGADVAAKAAAGLSDLKRLDPFSQRGFVGGSYHGWESPDGKISGEIAIPTSIKAPEKIKLNIDTTGNSESCKTLLFDAKNLYRSGSGCGCSGSIADEEACVYIGNNADSCNRYESIVSMLCSKVYIISNIRMVVEQRTKADGTTGFATTQIPITITKTNEYAASTTSIIDPTDHISPNQFNNNIVDIPLTGDMQRLDEFTCWILEVPPGLHLSLYLYVALRSA